MRRDRLEVALHRLSSDGTVRRAFKADPDAALDPYGLDQDDRRMIKDLDVRGLDSAGVNPLLTWGLWLLYGGGNGEAYLARLREPEVET